MLVRLALVTAALFLPCLAQAVQVEARGAVTHPDPHVLPAHARLSDAAIAAGVRDDAYVLGAAWLRPSLVVAQQRQKAGLMFDVASLHQHAVADERPELAALTASLGTWLQAMPVTGRQVALLDPRAVEITPSNNRPLAEGDVLVYPRRPTTIRVVGAVEQPCELPQVGLQDTHEYLPGCPRSALADKDRVFVIEPDGRVFEQPVALWNRKHPLPLAPGAIIVVPLRDGLLKAAPEFNHELVDFLATQTLDGDGGPR